MPTSSTSNRQARTTLSSSTSNTNKRWQPNQRTSREVQINELQTKATSFKRKSNKISNQQGVSSKYNQIKHISSPTSLSSTSTVLLRNSMTTTTTDLANKRGAAGSSGLTLSTHPTGLMERLSGEPVSHQMIQQVPTMSIAGHLMMTSNTTGSQKQPESLSYATTDENNLNSLGGIKSTNYLVSNSQYNNNNSNSKSSLHPPTTSSSTAQLHSLSSLTDRPPLSIRRRFNLKYVKSLIILLMVVDLTITVFVHQFASQDQLSIWLTSYKMQFSLLNLLLSSIWFIILIGAILFDIYLILLISCLVDVFSFILLLIFSIVHFSRKIDYNTVNLTSLLALLFSVIVLHVYLVVMAALTIYLTLAVKRRKGN